MVNKRLSTLNILNASYKSRNQEGLCQVDLNLLQNSNRL